MKTKSIGFIGGGRITKIFLQAFKNQNIEFSSIKISDSNKDMLADLKSIFSDIETTELNNQVVEQDVVFIALHPPVIGEAIGQLKAAFKSDALIISLAPKLTIKKLSELTGSNRIARMIPNATSYINQGYNPVCFSDSIENTEKTSTLEMLNVLGNTFETEESKLEAYAIVSAMLPTYFWFQWKEMEKIANEIGLSEEESHNTIYETLKASLEIMYNANLEYEKVNDLIPVKPIGENEPEIKEILNKKLLGLFEKIKP